MKNHYTLLGQSNVIVGTILDILFSCYDQNVEVEIVQNLKDRHDEIEYLHNKIVTKDIYYKSWSPKNNTHYVLAVNKVQAKKTVVDFFEKNCGISSNDYVNCIHDSSVICNGVSFKGAVNIQALSVVAQYATLEKFVSINRNVSIGHHTHINEYTTINPGVNIGGHVNIGKGVMIGMGSNIFDNITIGDNVIIGGGSTVTKNVADNTLIYGSPAKVIKTLDKHSTV